MNRIAYRLALLAAAFPALAGGQAHAAALGSAFTYQGNLYDNGQPAEGNYDFYIHLYDSAIGGTPTNPVGLTQTNVQVTGGTFTLHLDFGPAAFTGDARWLNIQVRPSGGAFYTALAPRQPLTAAPYAVHAKSSDQWKSAGSGITNGTTGFVGVNRSDTVSATEFFGVQAPVSGTSYGGMYVRTDSPTAKPYYGYSTGTESAWTYLDGASGDLRINNGGDRVTVTDDGNVGIGTTAPSARLDVPAAANGAAAKFENSSAANAQHTVEVANNGTGSALRAVASGIGPSLSLSSSASGPALRIEQGGIEVEGAGVGTPTPVFIHWVTLSSMYGGNATRIDHPLCNGRPDAILIVTQRFETGQPIQGGSFGTAYLEQEARWFIVALGDLGPGDKFNVLVVNP